MKVKIKRVDKSLPLPKYQTKGSVGFDFVCRETVAIPPKKLTDIPINNIIKAPKGYMLMLVSRSSTPKKKGLMVANSVGIIDQDYCGDDDELRLLVYNFTSKKVTVEKGERIAQGIFVKVGIADFEEVNKMKNKSRGGFGSTGSK